MNKCPITYEPCDDARYSSRGLNLLSSRLTTLIDFPFTALEQRREAADRAGRMSIQGVQPKLSVSLSVKDQCFTIVDQGGTFILKPQSGLFPEVSENEDLTMKMAKIFGIEVPLTGLLYSKDGSFSYFIKRFDRYSRNKKYHVEDFAQLTENNRDTKYNWSMEKLIPVLEQNCTFPQLEKSKLFRRVLFCFITGNEDMHLKNFSLIMRNDLIELSPAYDLLNSTIAMKNAEEEMALPLGGKKKKISRKLLFDYYGKERMGLTQQSIKVEMENLWDKREELMSLVLQSFLSEDMKQKYIDLLEVRYDRLFSGDI